MNTRSWDEELRLRRVSYKRHEFHHEPIPSENSLLGFVYDIPYFAPCGIFPPLHLLNSLLLRGGADGGMSPGATWIPFEISREEYNQLVAAVQIVPVDELKGHSRYAHVLFNFDSTFDQLTDYLIWAKAVCEKHRDQWHAKLREVRRNR